MLCWYRIASFNAIFKRKRNMCKFINLGSWFAFLRKARFSMRKSMTTVLQIYPSIFILCEDNIRKQRFYQHRILLHLFVQKLLQTMTFPSWRPRGFSKGYTRFVFTIQQVIEVRKAHRLFECFSKNAKKRIRAWEAVLWNQFSIEEELHNPIDDLATWNILFRSRSPVYKCRHPETPLPIPLLPFSVWSLIRHAVV